MSKQEPLTRSECLDVLGLNRQASPAEIRKAFRRLVWELHPDRNPTPSARGDFRQVVEAYKRLKELEKMSETPRPTTIQPHEMPVIRTEPMQRVRLPYWQIGLPAATAIALTLGLITYTAAFKDLTSRAESIQSRGHGSFEALPYYYYSFEELSLAYEKLPREARNAIFRESITKAIAAGFLGGAGVILLVYLLEKRGRRAAVFRSGVSKRR